MERRRRREEGGELVGLLVRLMREGEGENWRLPGGRDFRREARISNGSMLMALGCVGETEPSLPLLLESASSLLEWTSGEVGGLKTKLEEREGVRLWDRRSGDCVGETEKGAGYEGKEVFRVGGRGEAANENRENDGGGGGGVFGGSCCDDDEEVKIP